MATYSKTPTGKWRAQVYKDGQRASATFHQKSEARAWATRKEVELSSKRITHTKLTLKQVLDRYIDEVVPRKKNPKQEEMVIKRIKKFPFTDLPVKRIDTTHISEWKNIRLGQVSSGTVNRELNLISHCFNVAKREWKIIHENPVSDVARPKNPKPRDRRISQDEIDAILAGLSFEGEVLTPKHRVAVVFLFAIETAMRVGEICKLTYGDINEAGNVATCRDTKNGDDRKVPLSKEAQRLLALLGSGPNDKRIFGVSKCQVDSMFRYARQSVGIVDLHFHDTRHEAITRLSKKLSVLQLARMVGHKDIKMLMIYYNESAEDLAAML